MRVRPVLVAAAAGLMVTSGLALAAPAPPTTTTSKTLFLAANGCGATQEPGRLEEKAQDDTSDGCGTRAGLPLDEIGKQVGPVGELFGLGPSDYTSTKTLKPLVIDATKKITGQLVAGAHDVPVGIGTATFDVTMTAVTTTGKTLELGSVTASGSANGAALIEVPFELPAPTAAAGTQLRSVVLSVLQRGQNLGYSSNKFKGVSYVVIPLKAKKK